MGLSISRLIDESRGGQLIGCGQLSTRRNLLPNAACSRPNTLVMQAGGISVLIPRYSCARTGTALSSEHGYSGKGETGRGCG